MTSTEKPKNLGQKPASLSLLFTMNFTTSHPALNLGFHGGKPIFSLTSTISNSLIFVMEL
jgi:hypothetical protein